MADSAEGRRVRFRELTPQQAGKLKATLGPLVTVANPLDYHTFIWADEPAMTATFSALVGAGFDLNLLVLDFPRGDRCSDADWWPTLRAFETALKTHQAKGAVVASLPENLSEVQAAELLARGIVPLAGFDDALSAAEAAATIGTAWLAPPPPPVVTAEATANGTTKTLDEAVAKALLARHGVRVPVGRRVDGVDAAVDAAEARGFPVAVKALGVAHKTEAAAVRLNLQSPSAVRAAAADLLPLGSGLYVERMIGDAVAELIVGLTRDPPFGQVLTLGAGGVLVELLHDTTTLLVPAGRREIEGALLGLRSAALLTGYRGRPKADLAAAVDAIEAVQRLALDEAGTIVELDINPLIVCAEGQGAFAADALIVRRHNADVQDTE